MEDISHIQKIRKSLDITQKELAKYSGVSQSLIAKIESGKIDPAYSKIVRIFNSLNSISKKKEFKARDLMTEKIIFVSPDEPIKKAISKMKKNNISQLPVIKEKNSVGRISESNVLDAITESISTDSPVSKIMDESPPSVSPDTNAGIISSLLKQYNFVLVTRGGKTVGVITKADFLTKVF